jgi:putative flippase GtrA
MTAIGTAPRHRPAAFRPQRRTAPLLEIVVPVYNEEVALGTSIRRLHAFASAHLPFSWRVVIADNASTDGTLAVARALAAELAGVAVAHLDAKGRGRALRATWLASDAEVLCYMDVDLSTDLRALLPLVAPLVSGHSDLAIGTRLAGGARVVRGRKRELISRAYNRLLRTGLRARFSDAQCGFKAGRAAVLRELVPAVRDEQWFFDTELLVLAQRRGLRIHEVPVDWVDDPDSSVDIVRTALDDLRGVARLLGQSRLLRFCAVGALSTVSYALVYLALRGPLTPAGANAVALALTAVANTAANRRWTFGVRGRAGLLREHAAGAAVFLLTLALSTAALGALRATYPHAPEVVESTALVAANLAATLTRFLALRILFAGGGRGPTWRTATRAMGRALS